MDNDERRSWDSLAEFARDGRAVQLDPKLFLAADLELGVFRELAEVMEIERDALRARVASLEGVLRAYEQWEADIVLSNEAWKGGMASYPTLTQPLYDRMLEIQAERNAALAGTPTPPKRGREIGCRAKPDTKTTMNLGPYETATVLNETDRCFEVVVRPDRYSDRLEAEHRAKVAEEQPAPPPMGVEEAVRVLNAVGHRGGRWAWYPSRERAVRASYLENIEWTEFEAVAVAEKYRREGKG